MKYRVVAREDSKCVTYFAQRRIFWTFWVDLSDISIPGDFEYYPEGRETPSRTLQCVLNYVHYLKETEKILNDPTNIPEGHFIKPERVVKTYD